MLLLGVVVYTYFMIAGKMNCIPKVRYLLAGLFHMQWLAGTFFVLSAIMIRYQTQTFCFADAQEGHSDYGLRYGVVHSTLIVRSPPLVFLIYSILATHHACT